jgi:ABC-type sugar transport system substrate-binding protein
VNLAYRRLNLPFARPGGCLKAVALLLDEMQNRYQQLLVRRAKEKAALQQIRLLVPQFAESSSWTQLESINVYLRGETPPDAMLVMLAGEQHTGGWLERAISRNVAVIFLNRIPIWMNAVGSKFPNVLVGGVAPTQRAVGELQAAQAMRIVRPGAFVMLITGAARSPAAIERQQGFTEGLHRRLDVTVLDGRWSAQEAEVALSDWFRVGVERARTIDLIVCQNDTMAAGAYRALSKRAKELGRPELAKIPLIGCDGLEEEGQQMVRDGILTATVVLPATTPAAIDILQRYWSSGLRADMIRLEVESFPLLQSLRTR